MSGKPETMSGEAAKNGWWALATAAFVLMAGLTMGACTEVDDRLGANLVPKNQKMEIEVTSPETAVRTYLYREDSIPASRTGKAWFGRTIDADRIFGAQKSSVLLQFLPSSLPYAEADGYGLDPIVDSAMILFTLTGTRGDTTRVQRFDVWDVAPAAGEPLLNRDSVYYTSFPIEKYRGRNRLFHFEHSGRRNVAARLFPTTDGKKYLDSIVRLKNWDDYTTDSLFYLKFQGLYITPAEGSEPAAAIYGSDLSASGIQLWVRNHDTLDRSAIYDTITTLFSFQDSDTSAVPWDNVSINMTEFDYTGSLLGDLEIETHGFTDTLPTDTPQSTLYVQSGGGVGAYLRFTDELVDEIRNLRFRSEEGQTVGKEIFINQAMMRIWLDDDSTPSLDRSMSRLGSYLNMKRLTPIPDYQYTNELYQNESYASQGLSTTYTLPYNGYLNRSNGYYELDITSYVQRLAKIKEGDPDYMYIPPAMFIAPEAYGIFGTGQSVLKGFGSGDKSISIRITYTIIEG